MECLNRACMGEYFIYFLLLFFLIGLLIGQMGNGLKIGFGSQLGLDIKRAWIHDDKK